MAIKKEHMKITKGRIFFLVILGIVLIGIITLLVQLAYRAEIEGVSAGAPNYFISDTPPPVNNAGQKTPNSNSDTKIPFKKGSIHTSIHVNTDNENQKGAAKNPDYQTAEIGNSVSGSYSDNENNGNVGNNNMNAVGGPEGRASSPISNRAGAGTHSVSKNVSSSKRRPLKSRIASLIAKDETSATVSANIPKYSYPFMGFENVKNGFTPSTLGILEITQIAIDKHTERPTETKKDLNILINVSGKLAEEMFVFGIYNDMHYGKLAQTGSVKLVPQGKPTNEYLYLNLIYTGASPEKKIQLPVIANGSVYPIKNKKLGLSLNSTGKLSLVKKLSNPVPIKYRIARRSKNSGLVCSFPESEWLNIEFTRIPYRLRGFLDKSKESSDEYKMLLVYTVMNKCFGYQKDIIPVKLPKGMTWGDYLNKSIGNNHRLIADCDVLSTYAFIFMRYLGLKSAVCIGYENKDRKKMSTLTTDEYHAANYVSINGRWKLFDPSDIVPDMSETAMILAVKAETDTKIKQYLQSSPDISEDERTGLIDILKQETGFNLTFNSSSEFKIPSQITELMSEGLFPSMSPIGKTDKKVQTIDLSFLDLDTSLLNDMFPGHSLLKRITGGIIMLLFIILFISFLIKSAYKKSFKPSLHFVPKGLYLGTVSMTFLSFLYLSLASLGIYNNMWESTNWFMITACSLIFFGTLLIILADIEYIKTGSSGFNPQIKNWEKRIIPKLSRNLKITGYMSICVSLPLYCPDPLTVILGFVSLVLWHFAATEKENRLKNEFPDMWFEYSLNVPKYL